MVYRLSQKTHILAARAFKKLIVKSTVSSMDSIEASSER